MAQNKTGTYVHVHPEGGGDTVVVPPGGEFPTGYSPDKSLTTEPGETEADFVAGPGQFASTGEPLNPSEQVSEWRKWKVPELRAALGDGNYDEADRKDTLVEKATAAGIDPTNKPSA